MREILFRGKRVNDDEWVCGFYCVINEENHRIYTGYAEADCGTYYPDWYTVRPETVSQFTGLTDKNGTKIFEGDIVNLNTKTKDNLFSHYNAKNIVVRFDEYHRFVASGSFEYPLCEHCEWKVIGNIHDNPELLGGARK